MIGILFWGEGSWRQSPDFSFSVGTSRNRQVTMTFPPRQEERVSTPNSINQPSTPQRQPKSLFPIPFQIMQLISLPTVLQNTIPPLGKSNIPPRTATHDMMLRASSRVEVGSDDGRVVVIESTPATNEVYLLADMEDDIQTTLSLCSAYAETGAPDIRHLTSQSSSYDKEDKVEEEKGPIDQEEEGIQHQVSPCFRYTSFPFKVMQDINDCSFEMSEVESSLTSCGRSEIPQSMFGFSQTIIRHLCVDESNRYQRPVDTLLRKDQPPHALSPPSRYQRPVDSLLIRNKQHRSLPNLKGGRPRNLFVHASTPSRYQQPADSLLFQEGQIAHGSHQNPSPIPTYAKLKYRRPTDTLLRVSSRVKNTQGESSSMRRNANISSPRSSPNQLREDFKPAEQMMQGCSNYFSCENFNPQSPLAAARTELSFS